jgi:hypothetical protein
MSTDHDFRARKKPLEDSSELMLPFLLLVSFGMLALCILGSLLGGEASREQLSDKLGLGGDATAFLIFLLMGLGVVAFFAGRRVWNLLYGKRLLDHGSATATATIIDRRLEKESGCLSLLMGIIPTGHIDYYVTFEFNAAEATRTSAIVKLMAQVEEDLYERLRPGTTAKVRYAKQDPRIVLFEIEWG